MQLCQAATSGVGGDSSGISLAEQLSLACTDDSLSDDECVPECGRDLHGCLLLLNIDGDDTKLSCELQHGQYSWLGAASEGGYIGPDFEPLRRIYWDGALGGAKKHIDATTRSLDARLQERVGGSALTSMNPAVVTGASVAIPAMLKYIADYLAVVDSGVGAYDDPLDVGINFARALYGDGEPWRDMLDDEELLELVEMEIVGKTS